MVSRQPVEQREIGRRLDVCGRHAHQARDRQIRRARLAQQRGQIGDRAAALLRLVADIDLDEAVRPLARLVHRPGERGNEGRAVDGMNGVEQRDRILGLVGLELADEMQRDAGMGFRAGPAISPAPPAPGSRRRCAARPRSAARWWGPSCVFEMAMSCTDPGARPATRSARVMVSRTALRRSAAPVI